jgi:uncharacterized membrane protein
MSEMSISVFLKLYAVALTSFMVLDLLWLGVVARSFYRAQLGHLMRADVNWAAAVSFYLVFVVGIVLLVVWPAIERASLRHALLLGALFGLVTYAAYDLTNLATLEGFPVQMVVVDLLWGTLLCSGISAITYVASTRI